MPSLNQAFSDFQDILTGVGSGIITELKAGLVVQDSTGAWSVKFQGKALPAVWLDSVNPYPGSPCVAGIVTIGRQATAWVLGVTQSTPNLGWTGTVGTVAATTALITISGTQYTGVRVSCYNPVAGDTAFVEWRGGTPYLMGTTTVFTPPPVAGQPDPPPAPLLSGTFNCSIVDSGTWSSGYNWNDYYGSDTYTGSGYIPTSSGNWFYGGAVYGLADKTNINAVRFYLGARTEKGAFSSPVAVNFYVHNADWRGTTEPTRVSGPFTVTIPARWPGGWVVLPASVGVSLKSGGGLSIAGDPYAGFVSGPAQPTAGALSIDWSK